MKEDSHLSLFVMLLLHILFGTIIGFEICVFTLLAFCSFCRRSCPRDQTSDNEAGHNIEHVEDGNGNEGGCALVSNVDKRKKNIYVNARQYNYNMP